MKNEVLKMLDTLNTRNYSNFVASCLGYKAFKEHSGEILSSVKGFIKSISYPKTIAYKVKSEDVTEYVLEKDDKKNYLFHDKEGNVYDVSTYFDGIDEMVPIILMSQKMFPD